MDVSVTENGFAVKDEHSKPIEEALQDDDRVNYFKGITENLMAAVLEDSVDVRAYFPWSTSCSHAVIKLSDCASSKVLWITSSGGSRRPVTVP